MTVTEQSKRRPTTVPLRRDEAYHTACPMASADNVDQEPAGKGELP
jgi:hypothetical protein